MSEAPVRNRDVLSWSTEIQAIAQTGLAYAKDRFDLERYHQLMDIAAEMLASKSGHSLNPIQSTFLQQKGYASPKVDVRAFIMRDQKVLLVQERQDKKWALPGGWADVNHTPSESIIKEIHEETGYRAKVHYLLALWDTALHDHPPHWPYIYKCIFACEVLDGGWVSNHETLAADFFPIDALPELSTHRITERQLQRLHTLYQHHNRMTEFD
ncbi:MAG: NUDIX hydrolase [Legionellaceae bacterium]|nr:NUDIX hydrolase [Legionellaceae bacterium]